MTAVAAPTEFSTQAPEGAEWSWEEVKTKRGTESLGLVPILVWRDHDRMVEHYGIPALLDMADGTSLRVSFQSIARRHVQAGKSLDDAAKAMIEFKPGKRGPSESTPQSRARRLAGNAAEKLENKESLEKLLAKIASGELSEADLVALVS